MYLLFSLYCTKSTFPVRQVRSTNASRIPIYVRQQCPTTWNDDHIRVMCETEAMVRETQKLPFDHFQDMPVLSHTTGVWYRNVYCSACHQDMGLVKWDTYIYCNGDTGSQDPDKLDFSEAYYHPRTMSYRRVRVEGTLKNCHVQVKNFHLKRLLEDYGARLCKDVVSVCREDYEGLQEKCDAFNSYVYQQFPDAKSKRKVFRNGYCAQCNGESEDNIVCIDPVMPPIYTMSSRESELTMLFDFNYKDDEGGDCLLSQGQIWDPIFKTCQNFTCGALFERKGKKCILKNDTIVTHGIKDDCPKIILNPEDFHLLSNGSAYINRSMMYLNPEKYEVHERNPVDGVTHILVCLSSDSELLPITDAHYWLSVITLSISIVCLVLHLAVYAILKSLRNIPGKIMMSLASSLLCGHVFLLIGRHFRPYYVMCYINGVLIHFGYLSAFAWMSVMAYDIHGTFAVTQTQTIRKTSKIFHKYSAFAWTSALCIITSTIVIDHVLTSSSVFRPSFGDPICWFNNPVSLLIFFVTPATVMLIANAVLFAVTAFSIRRVSQQTKMVQSNLSDRVRYFLYLKLGVVLGLTWILGIIAAIARVDALWYPFIVLNGLQGALIFASFTLKRNILHMLAVKSRIRSDKYKFGQQKGIKAAMYSSLSTLTTLQTSVSSQIPKAANTGGMLKAVRRINPDDPRQKF